MKCLRCGFENEDTSNFCYKCGNNLTQQIIGSFQNKKKSKLFGFRSGKTWKKAIAIFSFIIVFLIIISAIFYTDECDFTVKDKILTKLFFVPLLLSFFVPYIWLCDFFPFKVKLEKNGHKAIVIIIAIVLWISIFSFCLADSDKYKSNEYKEAYNQLLVEQKNKAKAEEEYRKAEAKREEELRAAEEAKKEEESKKAEEARKEEESKREEESKKAEEARKEESKKTEEKTETEKTTEAVDTSVTYEEIYKEFNKNEIVAQKKYVGHRYCFSAKIIDIQYGNIFEDVFEGMFGVQKETDLTLEKQIDNTIVIFTAHFGAEQTKNFTQVSTGDTITIVGTCEDKGYFSDCALVLESLLEIYVINHSART